MNSENFSSAPFLDIVHEEKEEERSQKSFLVYIGLSLTNTR